MGLFGSKKDIVKNILKPEHKDQILKVAKEKEEQKKAKGKTETKSDPETPENTNPNPNLQPEETINPAEEPEDGVDFDFENIENVNILTLNVDKFIKFLQENDFDVGDEEALQLKEIQKQQIKIEKEIAMLNRIVAKEKEEAEKIKLEEIKIVFGGGIQKLLEEVTAGTRVLDEKEKEIIDLCNISLRAVHNENTIEKADLAKTALNALLGFEKLLTENKYSEETGEFADKKTKKKLLPKINELHLLLQGKDEKTWDKDPALVGIDINNTWTTAGREEIRGKLQDYIDSIDEEKVRIKYDALLQEYEKTKNEKTEVKKEGIDYERMLKELDETGELRTYNPFGLSVNKEENIKYIKQRWMEEIENERQEELKRMTIGELNDEFNNKTFIGNLIQIESTYKNNTFRVIGIDEEENTIIIRVYDNTNKSINNFSLPIREKDRNSVFSKYKDAEWSDEDINTKYDAKLKKFNLLEETETEKKSPEEQYLESLETKLTLGGVEIKDQEKLRKLFSELLIIDELSHFLANFKENNNETGIKNIYTKINQLKDDPMDYFGEKLKRREEELAQQIEKAKKENNEKNLGLYTRNTENLINKLKEVIELLKKEGIQENKNGVNDLENTGKTMMEKGVDINTIAGIREKIKNLDDDINNI